MPAIDPRSPRVRLFKNEHLERLTLISPRAFAVTWGLLLPLILWAGWGTEDALTELGLFAAGLFIWTIFEYLMHRYLFHLQVEVPAIKWLVYVMHGNHHDSPNDPLRGLMPFSVSLPIAALVWGTCLALIGASGSWLFLGFILGYVIYDTVHFACHQWPMRGKLSLMLKRHHMRHHYLDHHANYAISAIFWDRVFGTKSKSRKR